MSPDLLPKELRLFICVWPDNAFQLIKAYTDITDTFYSQAGNKYKHVIIKETMRCSKCNEVFRTSYLYLLNNPETQLLNRSNAKCLCHKE